MAKNIFITGASSGLGAALARAHARRGDSIALFARRAGRLKALAAECRALGAAHALALAGDITRPVQIRSAVARTAKALGGIDQLYANAGYGQAGALEGLSLPQWRRQMAVNVEGALLSVQACLPWLKRSKGRIVFTGSVVGYGSLSNTGAYAASKAALRALAQVLDLELLPDGVSVTLATLGYFASEIRQKDHDGRHDPDAPEYIPAWLLGDVDRVAAQLLRAAELRRRELIAPKHAKLAVFFLRHLPGPAQSLARGLGAARLKRRQAAQGR